MYFTVSNATYCGTFICSISLLTGLVPAAVTLLTKEIPLRLLVEKKADVTMDSEGCRNQNFDNPVTRHGACRIERNATVFGHVEFAQVQLLQILIPTRSVSEEKNDTWIDGRHIHTKCVGHWKHQKTQIIQYYCKFLLDFYVLGLIRTV